MASDRIWLEAARARRMLSRTNDEMWQQLVVIPSPVDHDSWAGFPDAEATMRDSAQGF